MEYNFLPYWYKEKYYKKKMHLINFSIVILIIINLISAYRLINIYSNINNLEDSIKNINYSIIAENKSNSINNNNVTLNNFKSFFDYVDDKLKFENITAEEKIINASIVLNDKSEYEEAVKYIEDNPSFKIVRLLPLQKVADNILKFQISVEASNWKEVQHIVF